MNEFEFAQRHLGQFKVKGEEIIPLHCPLCGGGKHRDKETFALNYERHVYKCLRGSCGRQGSFMELCREYGEMSDFDTGFTERRAKEIFRNLGEGKKKTYTQAQKPTGEVTDEITKYFELRKISLDTMKKFGIGSDKNGNIQFPFYRNEEDFKNQIPTFNKYRKPCKLSKGKGPKMWRDSNTEPILFGMHLADANNGQPLVIIEGEFDCMAAYEAGIRNGVSIPSGVDDYEWVDTCFDFIEQFRAIVIFGDNDKAGKRFAEKLSKKLSHHDIMICNYEAYMGHKDCNEILFYEGKEAVKAVVASAKSVPLYGIRRLADIEPLDLTHAHKSSTGFATFDKKTGGQLDGEVTVITGMPGAGKSTLISQIMNNNIENNEKVCVYSGELMLEHYAKWSQEQAAGSDMLTYVTDPKTGHEDVAMSKEVKKAIKEWWGDRYYIFDIGIENANKAQIIFEVFENVYKRYDVKIFVIDNLMTVDVREYDRDKYAAQEAFMHRVAMFAKRLGVHVYLVVHPVKLDNCKKITNMNQLSGTAAVIRAANNIWAVNRCDEEEMHDSELAILKSRMHGVIGAVKFDFDKKSKTFAETGKKPMEYGWRKTLKLSKMEGKTHPIQILEPVEDSDDFYTIAPVDDIPF